jgi:hypothetical protein
MNSHKIIQTQFNPSTKIGFSLPSSLMNGESSNINLSIYNSLGEKIETLVNSKLAPGTYEVDFDGSQQFKRNLFL